MRYLSSHLCSHCSHFFLSLCWPLFPTASCTCDATKHRIDTSKKYFLSQPRKSCLEMLWLEAPVDLLFDVCRDKNGVVQTYSVTGAHDVCVFFVCAAWIVVVSWIFCFYLVPEIYVTRLSLCDLAFVVWHVFRYGTWLSLWDMAFVLWHVFRYVACVSLCDMAFVMWHIWRLIQVRITKCECV